MALNLPTTHAQLGATLNVRPDLSMAQIALRSAGQRPCFEGIERRGLLQHDEKIGVDWSSLAADGPITKEPR